MYGISSTHNIAISDQSLWLNLNPIVLKFANMHIEFVAVIFGVRLFCVASLFVAFL